MTETTHTTTCITIWLDANRIVVPLIRHGDLHLMQTEPPAQSPPANDNQRDSYTSAWEKLETWKRQIRRQERGEISWSKRLFLKECRDRIRQLERRLQNDLERD